MKNYFWKYTIYLVSLLLLQFLILNNIIVKIGNWYFIPYGYLLFFMLLPRETNTYTMIGLAFMVGLIMDLVEGSLLMHTASLLFVSYLRYLILQAVAPQLGYNQGMLLSYLNYGINWFIKYAFIFSLIYHFIYFLLNNFSLINIIDITVQTIINSILTTIFLVILHYFFKNSPVNI